MNTGTMMTALRATFWAILYLALFMFALVAIFGAHRVPEILKWAIFGGTVYLILLDARKRFQPSGSVPPPSDRDYDGDLQGEKVK